MATLTVGVGEEFTTLAAAVAASQNGDVIAVNAGTYVNDFATVTDSITIESVGGTAKFVATVPPPNLKAILTVGSDTTASNINVTVDGLSFSGAAISAADGANAAGIRLQSGNLTVENSFFQNNQMGILTNNVASSSITVTGSEFAGQSTLPGFLAHQIYVGQIGSAVIEDNLFLANGAGHQIKDRAATSLIENNVIDDGTGQTSFDIDLPNGGAATVSGNQIVKGANDPNTTVISYGEEGMIWTTNSLTVSGNVIDNKLTGHHGIGLNNASSVVAQITDNEFYNLPTIAVGPNQQTGNVTLTSEPVIVDQIPTQTSPVAAETPILAVSAASGNEGSAIALAISASQASAALAPADLSVTVTGLGGATLNHGTLNADGSYTLQPADLSGLAVTPASGFAGTLALSVTATDTEPSSNTTAATAPATLDVTVNPVAEAPILAVQLATGTQGHAIPLAITASQAAGTLAASDLTVTVTGLGGATLNQGTHNADGSYTLNVAELTGLAVTPASGFVGTLALSVTATDTEPSSNTTAATAPEILDVTVSPASPIAEVPILAVSAASGNEGSAIALAISATQASAALAAADLSVTVSGLDGATLNHGTHNPDGSYTLDTSDLNGLAVTPASGFVGTIAFSVTATDTEPSSSTTAATAPEILDVTVNPVAEAPILAVASSTGIEGQAIALTIRARPAASTLSASDLTVTVTGLDGAILNHGTHNADGSYTLHFADLTGLTLTPASGFTGTLALGVTATDTEPSSHTVASSAPATLTVVVRAPGAGGTGHQPLSAATVSGAQHDTLWLADLFAPTQPDAASHGAAPPPIPSAAETVLLGLEHVLPQSSITGHFH